MDKPKDNKKDNGEKRSSHRRGSSFPRSKPEFDQKILNIRRVTRVVAGGRRFSFSVALVAGDKKGSVGLGLGKAGDTALAINKAVRNAKKNIVKLNLTKTMSIPHELSAKFSSSKVMLIPNKGRGLVAGSVIRDIVKLSGMKDVTGKIISNSKNKLNNAKAVIQALSTISSKYTKPIPYEIADAVIAKNILPEKDIINNKKDRIVGRGGRHGKTSGRGGKGQTARSGNKRRPELRDIIKRLPKNRGYQFKSIQKSFILQGGQKALPGEKFSEIRNRLNIKGKKIKLK